MPLTSTGRYLVLMVAFLGWMFAGVHMSITQLTGQPAAIDLLARTGGLDADRFRLLSQQFQNKAPAPVAKMSDGDRIEILQGRALVARWFAWYQCAFLFGAAFGGLVLGWLGDRIGRAKGMAVSILCYSAMAGVAALAQSAGQLLVLWFLAAMGVGGMWPNGVALVLEAWARMSRPIAAGFIGTSANIGLFLFASLAGQVKIAPEQWRWAWVVGAAPLLLGLFSLLAVPESPRWLAMRGMATLGPGREASIREVFQRPFLKITLVGILLATIPLIGGWGSANWMVPWADAAGEAADPPDLFLKARVSQARALTGIVGSLLGGWIASMVGRRRTYFFTSLFALGTAQYTFWLLVPTDRSFLFLVGALGFFSGVYFGWLPLFLPELFPTRIRSTGAGVSFNFGRILTATTIFAAGALMHYFEGDYARIGQVTSLVFAIGLAVIGLAPDTSRKELED